MATVIRRPFGQWLRSARKILRSSSNSSSSTVLLRFTMTASASSSGAADRPARASPTGGVCGSAAPGAPSSVASIASARAAIPIRSVRRSEREGRLKPELIHRPGGAPGQPLVLGLERREDPEVVSQSDGGTLAAAGRSEHRILRRDVEVLVAEVGLPFPEPAGPLQVEGRGPELRPATGTMPDEDRLSQHLGDPSLIDEVDGQDRL